MTESKSSHPFLSIVVPAYNEARRLPRALEQIRDYLRHAPLSAEVIVVDDGSTDTTAEQAELFDAGSVPIRVVRNPTNRGKGFSVREGMLLAGGEVLLMTDADQSTPIWEIEKLLPFLQEGHSVVIGSRDLAESEVTPQPVMRRVMGWALRRMRGALMLRDIRDTQCGFKAFTRRAARDIFGRARTDGFAFDCEVLLLARRLGYSIKEVGVVWCDDRDSRVRPVRDSLRMLVSLVRIYRRLRHAAPGPAGGQAEETSEDAGGADSAAGNGQAGAGVKPPGTDEDVGPAVPASSRPGPAGGTDA